jgi:glycogen debranching enzyme
VERTRELGAGIVEEITIHNYSLQPAACDVALSVDADFADLFEVKDGRFQRQWELTRRTEDGALTIEADWQGVQKGIVVRAPGGDASGEGFLIRTIIPAHGKWTVMATVVPLFAEADGTARTLHTSPDTLSPQERRQQAWDARIPLPRVGNPSVERSLLRSHNDIGALRIVDPQHPDRVVVAAGAPWFMALFGRDSLLSSFMVLPVDASLALGTLQTLADRQGAVVELLTEEQPGRILHEVRLGVSTGLALGGKSATALPTPRHCS